MRLPPKILETEIAEQAKAVITRHPGLTFDVRPAGLEWRFVDSRVPESDWCRAAYELAGAQD